MIRMITAHTDEVDDPQAALEEVLDKLDLKNLPKNAVGILTCHIDFIKNGTAAAICEHLPFDVLGCSTMIGDVCGEGGEFTLSLVVLAGEGVSFSSGVSESLGAKSEASITALYERIKSELNGDPVFALCFAPMLLSVNGDAVVDLLTQASDNVPVFGTIALDYLDDMREPLTIYNEEAYSDRLALLLVAGDVNPRFFSLAVSPDKVIKQKAIITSSSGNVLEEVNNMSAIKYMESLGLAANGVIEGAHSIPVTIDLADGSPPVARTIFTSTPEGFAVCGGKMPEGATLGIGSIDFEDVLLTATNVMESCLGTEPQGGIIIFSCLGRNLALSLDNMAEIECIRELLGDKIPYMFAYSAGEICPQPIDERYVNRFHNASIIACAF